MAGPFTEKSTADLNNVFNKAVRSMCREFMIDLDEWLMQTIWIDAQNNLSCTE